ncbi:hypothetical protein DM02DRAFT_548344, partial [Periconia macrospinosa]
LVLNRRDKDTQLQALLRIFLSFIFVSTGDDLFSSGLVYFLAVLRINKDIGRLRTAKNYLYMLASIIYCTKAITVEALLPSATRRE